MKPLYLSFLLFVPFALGARHYFVCDTLHWCGRASLAPTASVELTVAAPDGEGRTLALDAYLPAQVHLPASSGYAAALDSLVAWAAHYGGDYALRVDAPVLRAEGPTRAHGRFADLGLARASALARDLQARGLPAERIALGSYVATGAYALVPKLSFRPVVPKSPDEGLDAVALVADSMAFFGLRFDRNSSALEPEPGFVAYAAKLITAVNADPARRLRLIGHTDDRSTAAHNDSLGRWRAEAVAAYLQQEGLLVPAAVESRGAREPLTANDSPEARRLNRRVEAAVEPRPSGSAPPRPH